MLEQNPLREVDTREAIILARAHRFTTLTFIPIYNIPFALRVNLTNRNFQPGNRWDVIHPHNLRSAAFPANMYCQAKPMRDLLVQRMHGVYKLMLYR